MNPRNFTHPSRHLVAVAACCVAAISIPGCFLSNDERPSSRSSKSEADGSGAKSTPLRPSESKLNFGRILQGARLELSFSIHNPGIAVVEVAKVETSCPCLTVRMERNIVRPGERVAATAVLDLSDDPRFVGRLGLDVTGRGTSGSVVVFALRVDVDVDDSSSR